MAKMTQAQDDAYDNKNNIKESSSKDIKVDASHGLPEHMAKKSPILANKTNPHDFQKKSATNHTSAGVEKPHSGTPKPGSSSGK